jgi:hypothetical protein
MILKSDLAGAMVLLATIVGHFELSKSGNDIRKSCYNKNFTNLFNG